MRNSYAANARPRKREGLKRLILEVDLPFLAEIDGWGITSGHESRSAALRRLITTGLSVETAKPLKKAG